MGTGGERRGKGGTGGFLNLRKAIFAQLEEGNVVELSKKGRKGRKEERKEKEKGRWKEGREEKKRRKEEKKKA